MNYYPLVSIIIPVYNGHNYLKEAIDSALSQSYKNIEVLVINDGSIDDTEIIAKSYGNKIRYFRKDNGGVSSALNLGIREMNGDYFSWLSHDDKYEPQKIGYQINALNKIGKKEVLVYCNTYQIDKSGNLLKKAKNNKYLDINRLNPWDKSLNALVESGCFGGCALLIPKQAFKDVGFFDEELRFSQDFLMWSRILLKQYPVLYCGGSYVMSRVHNGQLTQRGRDIFYSDTNRIASILYLVLKEASNKRFNFVYIYSKYFAKYNCLDSLSLYVKNAKSDSLLSFYQRLSLKMIVLYGKMRPYIRKVYYNLFKKVKTK